MEDDRAAPDADLARDHLAEMKRGAQPRLGFEVRFKRSSGTRKGRLNIKETLDRSCFDRPCRLGPCDDDFVAYVLGDLATAGRHRLRGGGEHRREEAVRVERPEALGDAGRACDIDEEEEAPLAARLAVAAEEKVARGAEAEQLRDLHHDHEGERDREREPDRQGGHRLDARARQDQEHDRAVEQRFERDHGDERQPGKPAQPVRREHKNLEEPGARRDRGAVDQAGDDVVHRGRPRVDGDVVEHADQRARGDDPEVEPYAFSAECCHL